MTASYLTPAEYRSAATGQDTNNLVPGGSQGAQDAELARKIAAASAWIEGRCTCTLVATRLVELVTVPIRGDGLSIHPRNPHLNQLVSLQVGSRADLLTPVSIAGAWIEEEQFRIPAPVGAVGSAPRVLARLDYVAGWPNTVLTGNVLAGATVLPIASIAGFAPIAGSKIAGEPLRIIDGERTETVTVLSVGPSSVTLTAGCTFAHQAGVVVSQLPPDVKEAAVMATSAHLRHRSSDSLVMSQTLAPGAAPSNDSYRWKLLRDAEQLLDPYRRTR